MMESVSLIFFRAVHLQLSSSIREIYSFFDLNGDKKIDETELRYAFSSMVLPSPQDRPPLKTLLYMPSGATQFII